LTMGGTLPTKPFQRGKQRGGTPATARREVPSRARLTR